MDTVERQGFTWDWASFAVGLLAGSLGLLAVEAVILYTAKEQVAGWLASIVGKEALRRVFE